MGIWRRMNQSFWLALRDIRCYLMFTLRPEYVERQISLRKGACPKWCSCCGSCPIVLPNGRCSDYEHRKQMCRDSPIDRFDLWLIERYLNGRCSLSWDTPKVK